MQRLMATILVVGLSGTIGAAQTPSKAAAKAPAQAAAKEPLVEFEMMT